MSAQIPAALRAAIDRELEGVSLRALRHRADDLSAAYRFAPTGGAARGEASRLAYAVVRLPATYAAVVSVLGEITDRVASTPIRSLLDVGTGPGTALWAAHTVFPLLSSAEAIDRDPGMLALAQRLWCAHPHAAAFDVRWAAVRAAHHQSSLPVADLVTLSYLVGELQPADARTLVSRAHEAARAAVVIVEPGTVRGYESILAARDELISAGFTVVAPCPHQRRCPLAPPDWCHFAARLERSRAHRLLKGAELSWEDEKFSYVAAVRGALQPGPPRILRRPHVTKGRIDLRLCTSEGIVDRHVTRKDGERWREARHARWGGRW